MAVTFVAVAVAAFVVWQLWIYYTLSPWTRDARVLANVVKVAPDVAGLISKIHVKDNQPVKKGDLLFEIDPERYTAALHLAQANVENKTAAVAFAKDNAGRFATLQREDSPGFSAVAGQRMDTIAAEAEASLAVANAELAVAQINMRRSRVHASVDGYVTNLTALEGDYANTGEGVLAVVDSSSFYVYGYFMETRLPHVQEGAKAQVTLMAGGVVIDGVVEGVSRAISNPDDAGSLLSTVDPSFSWIRLAQRIPVRIRLGEVPEGTRLSSGMSATIVVLP